MKNYQKLIIIVIILLITIGILTTQLYTNQLETDNQTLIITNAIGEFKGLEVGIAAYSGYKQVPMVLTDDKIPIQLKTWIPSYIMEHNITKIIVVGDMDSLELFELSTYTHVQQITGNNKQEILTKIADNTLDHNNDTIILTPSDPEASLLGAYMKIPVFVTAKNGEYESDTKLDVNYKNYIEKHQIKKVIIVGQIPDLLKNELKDMNIQIEEYNGINGVDKSIIISEKIKELSNSTIDTAYAGFYGEIPSTIKNIVACNAISIEDPTSNNQKTVDYLKQNNITQVFITRNTPSSYIQMEEPDYITENFITLLHENNINTTILTNNRTLNELTGLYGTKKIVLGSQIPQIQNDKSISVNKEYPPLIDMLYSSNWIDSNNQSVHIQGGTNHWIVKWYGIHTYYWTKIDQDSWCCTSKTGYEWFYTKQNNTWNVEYKYNNTTYYYVKWIKNQDNNTWTEIHENNKYLWISKEDAWICTDNMPVYTIRKNN
ncbi:MAG: hypothetical protein Q4Q23_02245 [Methanobacteriaceae archaeon]|nr:hypothetical protein [Methanobacteriaceae archaeon]